MIKYVLILLPAAVILWLLYEWFQHRFVQCKTTVVECQKLSEEKELKLCLITDLHNNKKNNEKLMRNILNFAPDIILLAGDFINKHKADNFYAVKFMEDLCRLQIPVFYSQGNHELSMTENDRNAWSMYLSKLPRNVNYLDNEAVLLNPDLKICVSGLSLPPEFYKKGNLYKNEENLPQIDIPENSFHILMAHNPEYAALYQKYRADFIVAGHLHGGLLRLPFIGGVVSPRLCLIRGCDAGLVKLSEHSFMFVSRGIGSHTIPLRFFNRAEINFLVLKSK